jgi:hypothetical protein
MKGLAINLAVGVVSSLIAAIIFRFGLKLTGRQEEQEPTPFSWSQHAAIMMVPIVVVVVSYLSYQYWAVSNYERIGLICGGFVVAAVLAGLQLWSHQLQWRPGQVQAALWVLALFSLYLFHLGMPKYIRGDCPAQVQSRQEVTGVVAGSISNYFLYPVVFNDQGIGFVQPVSRPTDQNYHWGSKVYFGGTPKTQLTLFVYASPAQLDWEQGDTVVQNNVIKMNLLTSSMHRVEVE